MTAKRTTQDVIEADLDRAAKKLNPLVIHTADWHHSADPEKRALFLAAHDLLGVLASIRTGVAMLGDALGDVAAELPEECWVTKTPDIYCTDFIGGTIGESEAEFQRGMCCLPCRVRLVLE